MFIGQNSSSNAASGGQSSNSNASLVDMRSLTVWKTIVIGIHKDKNALVAAVEAAGHNVVPHVKSVVENEQFKTETAKRTIELFTATVAELGFPYGARVDAIYTKLDELGFGICPSETALQLRIAYLDQSDDCRLIVAEPVAEPFGDLRVLSVESFCDSSSVGWDCANPDHQWYDTDRLVFCRK